MQYLRRHWSLSVASLGCLLSACSQAAVRPADEGTPSVGAGATSGSDAASIVDAVGSAPEIALPPPGPDGGAAPEVRAGGPLPTPADFTKVESGGFKLGPPLTSDATASTPADQKDCNFLLGVVRDFRGRLQGNGHPDFESFGGMMPTRGLVGEMLGPDRKPVYTGRCQRGTVDPTGCPSGVQTSTAERFAEWYRRVDGVNQSFLIYFSFQPVPGGLSRFDSQTFFPLDGAGFGNSGADEMKRQRNFHFTTELHARIRYGGGEKFTFSGDDDLWVHINDKLALDMGGLHPAANGTIDLDAMASTLGISKGNVYPLELFHAERRTDASHFRVETNFVFVDCGQVVD